MRETGKDKEWQRNNETERVIERETQPLKEIQTYVERNRERERARVIVKAKV